MAQHIPGTVFIVDTDNPTAGDVAFLGDPNAEDSFTELFSPARGPAPTDLSLPWLKSLTDLPGLPPETVSQFSFIFFNLSSLTFDNMKTWGSQWQLSITESNNYSLRFPALTDFNGSISDNNNTLVSVDCPEVTIINSLSQNLNLTSPVLTALNFPKLTYLQGDIYANQAAMTRLNFPSLRTLDNGVIEFTQCAALTDITSLFGLRVLKNSSLLEINNALTTPIVNDFLVAMAAGLSVESTGSTIDVSGQSPPAPPSGAGIAAVATLEGYGMTIITD